MHRRMRKKATGSAQKTHTKRDLQYFRASDLYEFFVHVPPPPCAMCLVCSFFATRAAQASFYAALFVCVVIVVIAAGRATIATSNLV